VVVLIESIAGDRIFHAGWWWLFLIVGLGMVQLGYAAAGAWIAYGAAHQREFETNPEKLKRLSER
jgi:hypothetical protein